MIYLTSDLHFDHKNILEYEPKRREALGETIEEHDAAIIKRINSRVSEDDILIILGDFSLGSGSSIKKYRDLILCKSVWLIVGNHDKHSISHYYRCGFSVVCYEVVLKVAGELVRLRHHPYRKPWYRVLFPWQYKERDRAKRPIDLGQFLAHGHTHSRQATKVIKRMINVGLDLNKYYPISLRDLESMVAKVKEQEKSAKENLCLRFLKSIKNLPLR